MKKLLYGTTALVAAGALTSTAAQAEEGIKLSLGGYMNQFFGAGSLDSDRDTDYNSAGLFSDGEVWFVGETTLDNGITFGANIQLESFGAGDRGGTADVIDEDFAYISGSFGRVNIGSENSAAYLMQYAAPNVGAPINSGWLSTFIPADGARSGGGGFRTPRLSTYLDWNNDENVITYFTPRFAGFQLGGTYAPTVSESGDGANFPIQADQDTEFSNGLAVGVNYVNTLGPVDLAVAGGYRWAKAPEGGVTVPVVGIDGTGNVVQTGSSELTGSNQAGSDTNLRQYSAGLNVGFSGVTIGASVGVEDSGRSTDGWGYDAGVSYGQGPWAVGATWFQSKVEGSGVSGDDELMALQAGASYAVGPGITASLSVLYADWESDNTNLDADGIYGIAGIKYKF